MANVKEKYRSKRNGKLATVLKVTKDHGVIVEIEGEEEYKMIAESTLQRWYELVEPVEPQMVPQVIESLSIETPPQETKKRKKKPTVTGKDHSEVISEYLNFINKMKEQYGITIFNEGKNKNFYSLKVDGKIYMAFTTGTQSGVNLWLRSKAVEGITEFKKINHMLDARILVNEWNMDTYQLMVKLHDACLKHQMEKNKNSKK